MADRESNRRAWFTVLLGAAMSTLACSCSRGSSPPPAADVTTKPVPAVAPAVGGSQSATPVASDPALPPAPAPSATSVSHPSGAPSSAGTPPSLDGDCSRLDQSPEYRSLPPEARTRSRVSCEAKQEFAAFVATRQTCTTARDCSIVTGACPFDCYVPTATAAVSEVNQKLTELGDRLRRAGQRCVYRCMNEPPPACVAGRCTTGAR